MTQNVKDTARALAAAKAIIDGRNPFTEYSSVLVTAEHAFALVLLACMGGDARDYEEGMSGRVYRVCGACIKRVNDEAQAELDAYDFGYDDDVYEDECFNCGGEGYVSDCFDGCCEDADSGCDLCTRRCDVCNPAKKGAQP